MFRFIGKITFSFLLAGLLLPAVSPGPQHAVASPIDGPNPPFPHFFQGCIVRYKLNNTLQLNNAGGTTMTITLNLGNSFPLMGAGAVMQDGNFFNKYHYERYDGSWSLLNGVNRDVATGGSGAWWNDRDGSAKLHGLTNSTNPESGFTASQLRFRHFRESSSECNGGSGTCPTTTYLDSFVLSYKNNCLGGCGGSTQPFRAGGAVSNPNTTEGDCNCIGNFERSNPLNVVGTGNVNGQTISDAVSVQTVELAESDIEIVEEENGRLLSFIDLSKFPIAMCGAAGYVGEASASEITSEQSAEATDDALAGTATGTLAYAEPSSPMSFWMRLLASLLIPGIVTTAVLVVRHRFST